ARSGPFGQVRRVDERRAPLEQRHDRCRAADREVLAVGGDHARPRLRLRHQSSSPRTRSTDPTLCTTSTSRRAWTVALRSASRALWVTKMSRAPPPAPPPPPPLLPP